MASSDLDLATATSIMAISCCQNGPGQALMTPAARSGSTDGPDRITPDFSLRRDLKRHVA